MRVRTYFVAALFGLGVACTSLHAISAIAASTSNSKIDAAALRADFLALYEGLKQGHYDLYAHTSKSELDRLFNETLASIDRPMSLSEAQVRFQTFVAAGKVAHARVDHLRPAYRAFREGGGKAFPLVVRVIGKQVFVRENLSGIAEIKPGMEITRLNGRSAADWITRMGQNVSADTAYLMASLVEQDFSALLWLNLGEAANFELNVREEAGHATDVAVPARSRAEMQAMPNQMPTLDIDPTERVAHMLPGGIAYLRPGVFLNLASGEQYYDAAAFHAFIDKAFEDFIAKGATSLLIDLRDNPGGDNSFSDHMVAWFADKPFRFCSDFRIKVSPQSTAANAERLNSGSPDPVSPVYAVLYEHASPGEIVHFNIPIVQPRAGRRFEGKVYVLVNRRAYSNSVSVAAIVQDYKFGTILGEPTADLATTYGAMEQFVLPNTGIRVGFPKAYIVRPNGDERIQGVTPDIEIATPIVEIADDPVLRRALEIVSKGPAE